VSGEDDDDREWGEDEWTRRRRDEERHGEGEWERRQRKTAKRNVRMFGSAGGGRGSSGRGGGKGSGVGIVVALVVVVWLAVAHWPSVLQTGRDKALSAGADAGVIVPVDARQVAAARRDLPGVPVQSRYPLRYTRASFGPAWTDDNNSLYGHNSCSTRDDILRRDLSRETFRPRFPCVVVSGTLHDPYTGKTILFTKANASAVQIDHIVSLAYAHSEGAWAWTYQRRIDFANDPLNLLAVDGPTNQAKGDSGPAVWQPRFAARCLVAVRTVQVVVRYRLPVARSDKAALDDMLRTCPPPRSTP
jgi:hypothetical protein